MASIFTDSYQLINEFISRPENKSLKKGTGNYSALFRGTLCGTTETATLKKLAPTCPAKVLWLGSNPNVPNSLAQIIGTEPGNDYASFLTQMKSGHFSEIKRDHSNQQPSPSWDPINQPNYGWRFYTEILGKLYGEDRVLMANYMPWGSKDFPQLLAEIRKFNPALLNRMVEFSTKLNKRLIEEIKPELIIAPKSIFRRELKIPHLNDQSRGGLHKHSIPAKVPFNFTIESISVGRHNARILIAPHPSYTPRIGKEHRHSIQEFLIQQLRTRAKGVSS